jgi:hypothetical protein
MKESQTVGRELNSFFWCQDFDLHTCRPVDDAGFDYRKIMACVQTNPFCIIAILAVKSEF